MYVLCTLDVQVHNTNASTSIIGVGAISILGGIYMEEKKQQPAKRVDIVQVKLVREKTTLYKNRRIRSPHDAYESMKEFLGDVDREHFVVLCLDTKNQPACIQTVHIGSLNSSIVHPREVLKPAILSCFY